MTPEYDVKRHSLLIRQLNKILMLSQLTLQRAQKVLQMPISPVL